MRTSLLFIPMLLLCTFSAFTQEAATAELTPRLATTPANRFNEGWWKQRFEQKGKLVAEGGWELVFLGDSITQGWEGGGKEVWGQSFAPWKTLNLGYSGDRTEHQLWRIENGELDGYQAKLFILMIGTNNTGHRPRNRESPEDTAAGIAQILAAIKEKQPDAKILLLAIFPRSANPDDEARQRNAQVNALIKPYADDQKVIWCDLAPRFLSQDQTLAKEIMPDYLHLTPRGYGIWAEAILPAIKKVLP